MSQPSITGVSGNIIVTAGDVVVDDGVNSPVDLGFVSKISMNIKELTTEVHTDQAGKSVVDDRFVGNDIAVEMELDELTAPRLKEAYSFGALIGSNPYRIAWGRNIGGSYLSLAKKLIIRPSIDDTSFLARNFTFYKATPIGDSKIMYEPNNKAVIKTKFRVYPDFTKPNNEYFGYFGDIAAGTFTGAIVAAAVAGSNTGNGTVGSESGNDTYTKTETWTLTCIAVLTGPNRALFSVVGSVSGSRGVATTGTAFHSNSIVPSNSEVNFTISEGGTLFVSGDSFTIATTAANYT